MNPSAQKILILAANPRGTDRLRLDEEVREIELGLQLARKRDAFVIKTCWATTPLSMQRAMLREKPNIVHFSGHGAGKKGLVFEDKNGRPKPVSAEALARLFSQLSDQVNCVLLNACYSQVQAQAIVQHIETVIGMNQSIGDQAAIKFATGFYDCLGDGQDVVSAYEWGCTTIELEGLGEALKPKLLRKTRRQLFQKTMAATVPTPKIKTHGTLTLLISRYLLRDRKSRIDCGLRGSARKQSTNRETSDSKKREKIKTYFGTEFEGTTLIMCFVGVLFLLIPDVHIGVKTISGVIIFSAFVETINEISRRVRSPSPETIDKWLEDDKRRLVFHALDQCHIDKRELIQGPIGTFSPLLWKVPSIRKEEAKWVKGSDNRIRTNMYNVVILFLTEYKLYLYSGVYSLESTDVYSQRCSCFLYKNIVSVAVVEDRSNTYTFLNGEKFQNMKYFKMVLAGSIEKIAVVSDDMCGLTGGVIQDTGIGHAVHSLQKVLHKRNRFHRK